MAAPTGMSEQLGASSPLRRLSNTGAKMAALALAQGAVYSFPVVFAVLCARNLGPSQYGTVAFYTALTAFLCMLVEFGFDSIGVREVHSSSWRSKPEQVLWHVTFAKLIICLPTCAVAVPILLATRSPLESSMSYAMVVYMVAFALEPSWYLRSLELMWSVAFVAVVSRAAGIAVLVRSVSTHDDLTLAMWAYAFVAWASAAVGWLVMRQLHLLAAPRIAVHHLRTLFKSGAAIVLGNLGGAAINSGGVVVLGAIADPVVTGAANMALRIRSAGLVILVPLMQLGFVRLSRLVGSNRPAAADLGRGLFYMLMACSAIFALLLSANADSIAAFAYGSPRAPAAAGMLVQVLAVGMPGCVAAGLFGVPCLTLFQEERAYVLISLVAVVIFFGLLLSFAARASTTFGWALVTAEVWIALAAGLRLRIAVRSHATA